jgi:hypothetical protein
MLGRMLIALKEQVATCLLLPPFHVIHVLRVLVVQYFRFDNFPNTRQNTVSGTCACAATSSSRSAWADVLCMTQARGMYYVRAMYSMLRRITSVIGQI